MYTIYGFFPPPNPGQKPGQKSGQKSGLFSSPSSCCLVCFLTVLYRNIMIISFFPLDVYDFDFCLDSCC